MYPLWAMSTGRDEIEGPNGGLRTRCGPSLCALSVCLFTYLWWKSLNGYLEHHFTQQHLVLHNIMSSSTPRSTAQVRRSDRIGSRAPRATPGSKARSKSPRPRGRGATADRDEAATVSDGEQSDGGDSTGAADATHHVAVGRALLGSVDRLGDGSHDRLAPLAGAAETAVQRLGQRLATVQALQDMQPHDGNAASYLRDLGVRTSGTSTEPGPFAGSQPENGGRQHEPRELLSGAAVGWVPDVEDESDGEGSSGPVPDPRESPGILVGESDGERLRREAAAAPAAGRPREATRAVRADERGRWSSVPGFVEEALTRERTATNILYRLKYVGSSDTCAVVAHKMRTDVVLMHYTLPDEVVKAVSRVDWRPSQVSPLP